MAYFWKKIVAEPDNVAEMMAILKSDLATLLPEGTKVRVEMEVAVVQYEGEDSMETRVINHPRISFDVTVNESEQASSS